MAQITARVTASQRYLLAEIGFQKITIISFFDSLSARIGSPENSTGVLIATQTQCL